MLNTRPQSYAELLEQAARDRPDDLALTYLDTGETYTNRKFHEAALRWAGALRAAGLGQGDTVAVMMQSSPEAYMAWFGIAWLRSYEVPLNTGYRGSILVHVLNNSGTEIAMVSSRFLDRIAEIASELTTLRQIVITDCEGPFADIGIAVISATEFLAGQVRVDDLTAPSRSDVAAIVYTSGTTGPSKGVVVPWASIASNAYCVGAETGSSFRLYSTWASYHISGKFAVCEAIARGGQAFLRNRWRSEQFWPDVRSSGATAAILIGNVAHFLWTQPEQGDDAGNTLTDVAMTPVPPYFQAFEQRFGLRIHSAYAMTEIGIPVLGQHPLANNRTCGRLVEGYQLRLVDHEGNDVGPNVMGEALIRSADPDMLFREYFRMPDETAQAWTDGWFHTGDGLMRDEDGNYYFVDRIKDSLRRRGENISSYEVENEFNKHPGVLESAAVEVATPDGDVEVMIYVVPQSEAVLDPLELFRFVERRLAKFMLPRYIRFLDELPKTHTNRTRKVELRARGLDGQTWDRVSVGVELSH